jgi:type IV pilus assembly protein PilA
MRLQAEDGRWRFSKIFLGDSHMFKKVQAGFTLIELMIVIAIIGILAAIAIPAYQDYVIRSQVSEGLAMAGAAKASVAEYFANKGSWPADNNAAGIGTNTDIKGKYVSEITIASGGITVKYGGDANTKIKGETIGLTPGSSANGDVVWKCANSAFASGAIGSGTSTAVDGVTSAGMLNKFLPSSCRS